MSLKNDRRSDDKVQFPDQGWGFTKAPFVNLSVSKFSILQSTFKIIQITFIFDRCHRSWAAASSVKYEHDVQYLTCVLTKLKNKKAENNGTDKIGLVTPTHNIKEEFNHNN